MTSPYDVMRARERDDNLSRAARFYCQEHSDEIAAAINQHAPELRQLIEETDAVVIGLRITAGDSPREIVSPKLIKQYVRENGDGSGD